MIHHYGWNVYPFNLAPVFFRNGNLAVSYFFVLSGFVLYNAHVNKSLDYGAYLRKRAARILPLYYVGLLLTVGVLCLIPPLPLNMRQQVVYGALLIQSYIPSYPLSLNLPAWSISVELFFYLLFPLLLFLEQRKRNLFLLIWFMAFIAAQYFHLKYYEQRHELSDDIVDTIFFNPVIHVSQFMTGMIGGYLYARIADKKEWPRYIPVLMSIIIGVIIVFKPGSMSYHTGLLAPLFLLLIIALAKSKTPILDLPFFVFLGEISYGVYILQYPVYRGLEILNGRYYTLNPIMFFYSSFLVLMLTTIGMHYFVDRPLGKLIRGKSQ